MATIKGRQAAAYLTSILFSIFSLSNSIAVSPFPQTVKKNLPDEVITQLFLDNYQIQTGGKLRKEVEVLNRVNQLRTLLKACIVLLEDQPAGDRIDSRNLSQLFFAESSWLRSKVDYDSLGDEVIYSLQEALLSIKSVRGLPRIFSIEDWKLSLSRLENITRLMGENAETIEKNVKLLLGLGLPESTQELEKLIEETVTIEDLGELFIWKATPQGFEFWSNRWFRKDLSYFVSEANDMLQLANPELRVSLLKKHFRDMSDPFWAEAKGYPTFDIPELFAEKQKTYKPGVYTGTNPIKLNFNTDYGVQKVNTAAAGVVW